MGGIIKKVLLGVVVIPFVYGIIVYGNKTEGKIRQEFNEKYDGKYSFSSPYLRIEEIDGHEYVIYSESPGGGVTHHEECPYHDEQK